MGALSTSLSKCIFRAVFNFKVEFSISKAQKKPKNYLPPLYCFSILKLFEIRTNHALLLMFDKAPSIYLLRIELMVHNCDEACHSIYSKLDRVCPFIYSKLLLNKATIKLIFDRALSIYLLKIVWCASANCLNFSNQPSLSGAKKKSPFNFF